MSISYKLINNIRSTRQLSKLFLRRLNRDSYCKTQREESELIRKINFEIEGEINTAFFQHY